MDDTGRTKEEMGGGPMERQPGLEEGLWERGESRPRRLCESDIHDIHFQQQRTGLYAGLLSEGKEKSFKMISIEVHLENKSL